MTETAQNSNSKNTQYRNNDNDWVFGLGLVVSAYFSSVLTCWLFGVEHYWKLPSMVLSLIITIMLIFAVIGFIGVSLDKVRE